MSSATFINLLDSALHFVNDEHRVILKLPMLSFQERGDFAQATEMCSGVVPVNNYEIPFFEICFENAAEKMKAAIAFFGTNPYNLFIVEECLAGVLTGQGFNVAFPNMSINSELSHFSSPNDLTFQRFPYRDERGVLIRYTYGLKQSIA